MERDELRAAGSGNDRLPSCTPQSTGSSPRAGDMTLILASIEQGQPQAAEQLLPIVYDELRKIATARMAQEKPGHTLQATSLVHEAYLRLVDTEKVQHWDSRRHFFSAAAEAMRRILVERARKKGRRPECVQVCHEDEFEQTSPGEPSRTYDLLALNDALSALERHDPQASELVKLRFFAGLTHRQAADTLGISRRTADRLWRVARAWLLRQLNPT